MAIVRRFAACALVNLKGGQRSILLNWITLNHFKSPWICPLIMEIPAIYYRRLPFPWVSLWWYDRGWESLIIRGQKIWVWLGLTGFDWVWLGLIEIAQLQKQRGRKVGYQALSFSTNAFLVLVHDKLPELVGCPDSFDLKLWLRSERHLSVSMTFYKPWKCQNSAKGVFGSF